MTGAELASRQKTARDIQKYRVGQVVEHAEYGIGRIEKLTGKGAKTMATIDFTSVGAKTFRLAFASLKVPS